MTVKRVSGGGMNENTDEKKSEESPEMNESTSAGLMRGANTSAVEEDDGVFEGKHHQNGGERQHRHRRPDQYASSLFACHVGLIC